MSLPDFVTPITSGMEPCDETDMRLSPEVQAEVDRKLKEFARHRAQALVSARNYVVSAARPLPAVTDQATHTEKGEP